MNEDEKINGENGDSGGDGADKNPKKKGGRVKKVILIVLITVLSVMLITAAAGVLLIHHYISKIEYVDPENTEHDVLPGQDYDFTDDLDGIEEPFPDDPEGTGPAETGEPSTGGDETTNTPPENVQWPDDNKVTTFDDTELLNILIVGQDRRAGQSARQRSDTMILVSINKETHEVSLISFLRDTYVQIPGGYRDNRLNTPYVWGGFKLLKETMKQNFGVTIDGCFECDFYDFIDIIDFLGGVEIDITEKEANHMKNFFRVEVSPGHQNLTGEQALAYARIRKIDSDFQRTNRQRKILLSLFNKFKNASVSELKSIADEILPKLTTDMTVGDRWGLLMELLPVVSKMKVNSYSVPFSGAYKSTYIRRMAVLVPDLAKIRQKLANEYLPFSR